MLEGRKQNLEAEMPNPCMESHRGFLLRNIDVVSDILEAIYESPDHGNKLDPMDELIYIHLSKKTHEAGCVRAYEQLSTHFPGWVGLADANPEQVRDLVGSAGLGGIRTGEILANAKKIRNEFGKERLDVLQTWSEERTFRFLTQLEGIGPKSARCIMMYSLGKEVFPVDTHVHTICERMGFIGEGLNHKTAQDVLSALFPKNLRYGLHVNMVAHGRTICRERGRPLCEDCELRKFCLRFRREVATSTGEHSPAMVDLFCGPGGASLGFRESGFGIAFAVDSDVRALDTYYLNNPELEPDDICLADLRELNATFLRGKVTRKVDLVIGGPPCQGWSQIGRNWRGPTNRRRFLEDRRNDLYREFVRQLDIFKPKYFVMENVPGLLLANDGRYARVIADDFRSHGYATELLELDAADYRVPQRRIRVFYVGRRVYGNKEGAAERDLATIIKHIRERSDEEKVSFREGIEGLPSLMAGDGKNVSRVNGLKNAERKGRRNTDGSALVYNHFAREHNTRDLEIFKRLNEGENYLDFSKRTNRPDLLPYSRSSFSTKFRKIPGDRPCFTVISHLSKDANSYVHPYDNRGITVREAARMQTFPDDFVFLGKGFRQFVQVGNAVPPRLAKVIGDALVNAMEKTR